MMDEGLRASHVDRGPISMKRLRMMTDPSTSTIVDLKASAIYIGYLQLTITIMSSLTASRRTRVRASSYFPNRSVPTRPFQAACCPVAPPLRLVYRLLPYPSSSAESQALSGYYPYPLISHVGLRRPPLSCYLDQGIAYRCCCASSFDFQSRAHGPMCLRQWS
jgi:hypothetical protein